MTTIAIVYHSPSGSTHKLAELIEMGAQRVKGVNIQRYRLDEEHFQHGRFVDEPMLNTISEANAIVMGSPTYMGSVSGQFKAFADATGEIWYQGGWINKVAAGFTIGSHLSGDQFSTIQYLQTLAHQHGMLWVNNDLRGSDTERVPNRLGAQCGLITQSSDSHINELDKLTAQYYGERVASIVQKVALQVA